MRIAGTHSRFSARRGRRAGFTMTELLVTAAVLAILMLAAGRVLTQAQRVVNVSQANMRANAQAAAMTRVLRADLRAGTKQGLLCITKAGDNPQLFISDAEVVYSLLANLKATGSVIGFGLCTDNNQGQVFWRAKWLCNEKTFAPDVFRMDAGGGTVRLLDLADVQIWSRTAASAAIDAVRGFISPQGLRIPVQDMPDVFKVWQALSPDCAALGIMWTRGERDALGNLKWYGVQPGGAVVQAGDSEVESSTSGYRALWTNENKNNWPFAVKFIFDLTDRYLPDQLRTYEVVCPIGE